MQHHKLVVFAFVVIFLNTSMATVFIVIVLNIYSILWAYLGIFVDKTLIITIHSAVFKSAAIRTHVLFH
mgnify:CR=1 FL=1